MNNDYECVYFWNEKPKLILDLKKVNEKLKSTPIPKSQPFIIPDWFQNRLDELLKNN